MDESKINWNCLSRNLNAIDLLMKNHESKINCYSCIENRAAYAKIVSQWRIQNPEGTPGGKIRPRPPTPSS